MMDKSNKQRLVGAVVLIALGLIFIPTILDFSQDEPNPLASREMPEAPDVMKMEVLPLEIWSERIDPKIDDSHRIVETPVAAVESGPVEDSIPAVEVKEPSTPEPVVTAVPEKIESKPVIPGAAMAWVVQVGSFGDEPKAFALRDRLRAAGHATFIERFQAGSGVTYRVKVGPVLMRSEADKLKDMIAAEVKLNGLVMQYQ